MTADLESLISDCTAHAERASSVIKSKELKNELVNNVWPWLQQLAQTVSARLGEHSEALNELIDQEESAIRPELAADILAVFEAGKQLAAAMHHLLDSGEELEDAQKAKIKQELGQYLKSMKSVSAEIAAVTLDADEFVSDALGDEGDEEDEDGEGADEPSGAEGESSPDTQQEASDE